MSESKGVFVARGKERREVVTPVKIVVCLDSPVLFEVWRESEKLVAFNLNDQQCEELGVALTESYPQPPTGAGTMTEERG